MEIGDYEPFKGREEREMEREREGEGERERERVREREIYSYIILSNRGEILRNLITSETRVSALNTSLVYGIMRDT